MLHLIRTHARSICYVALVLAILFFGWPTPYRYDTLRAGGDTAPVRINRFTGQAAVLTGTGWRPLVPRQASAFDAVWDAPRPPAKRQ